MLKLVVSPFPAILCLGTVSLTSPTVVCSWQKSKFREEVALKGSQRTLRYIEDGFTAPSHFCIVHIVETGGHTGCCRYVSIH